MSKTLTSEMQKNPVLIILNVSRWDQTREIMAETGEEEAFSSTPDNVNLRLLSIVLRLALR